ncbi:MAG: class I SAM-dependent methyltransferase [Candidatus Pacearchaeota archaeon]|jgi:SAM-dependent methyltransferase
MVKEEYELIGGKYAHLSRNDPLKTYVQYPGLIKLLGNVKGRKVLDIGCGDGFLLSRVAKKGAKVVGFDVSEKQIELANENEKKLGLGMEFFCSDQFNFIYPGKFDLAFSNMVIFYAANFDELVQFFKCAFNSLKSNGKFISVVLNPDYKRFGELHYNRKVILNGKKMRTEFFIDGKFSFSTDFYSFFSKQEYEKAALKGGFSKIEWKSFKIEAKGIKELGKDFWRGYKSDPLYSVFVVKK